MFPIDFYQGDEDKLRRLARITGLDYESLVKRDVNEVELARIINNIEDFATNVEARTFRSIRNKVKEVRPDTDLFEILKSKNINLYNELQYELLTRKD